MTAAEYSQIIQRDPSASYWLKDAVASIGQRDVLDALADAEALLEYCKLLCADA